MAAIMSGRGDTQGEASTRDAASLALLSFLAVLSRLWWVLRVHPPGEHVFRDMRSYVVRAQWLVEHGLEPWPAMAFQPPGTSGLLALPLAIAGPEQLGAAAVLWALFSAAAVPLTWALAREVGSRRWVAPVSAALVLVWMPALSYAGLFTSETPYCAALLLACWRLAALARTGRGGLGAGMACALAFLIRPQIAVAMVLIIGGAAWLRGRDRAGGAVSWAQLGLTAAPLVLAGLLSTLWIRHQVGDFAGVTATSSTLNAALGRCHLTRVQAFGSEPEMVRSRSLEAGRVVGAPALWSLHERFPDPGHVYALRPALGSEARALTLTVKRGGEEARVLAEVREEGLSLAYVGTRDDRAIHRALLRACRERTSVAGQVRYAVQNLSLMVAFNPQWPDSHSGREGWRRISDAWVWIFGVVVLLPGLLGIRQAMAQAREQPGRAVVALQLIGSMIVAALVFGSIRIRVPHDPLWLILACEGVLAALASFRRERAS